MKLIMLNTAGGRFGVAAVVQFIQIHADVDIFCLQEMWHGAKDIPATAAGTSLSEVDHDLFAKVQAELPEHEGYFNQLLPFGYGMAVFVKKSLTVVEHGDRVVYKERGYMSDKDVADHCRTAQYVRLLTSNGPRLVVHFHGLWNGQGKGDTPDRLLQSDKVINLLKEFSEPSIVMGDFNLEPDTESLKKFEQFGLRNLVKEYKITSTRTSLYKKPGRFADYTFVSPEVQALDFQVLPDEVSDHNALYLEFV